MSREVAQRLEEHLSSEKTTGLYPRLRVDTTTGCSAVGQAGGVLLTYTIRLSGLGAELSAGLGRCRKPTAVHDPAKIILDLAASMKRSGTRQCCMR